ncbi:putative cleavage and polyadenylation specificity factor subunit 4-like protein isoform X1 [Parus major]|uniref:putative cleavage and polyadenylation specificity factor subunit 4-like protein isoform X1 n=1 Tax=Parus major TaxID=9157 RepID=UPI0014441131|nr:putative cleavage and polyadenylation specificity factor subunit 4-like protein isoform X1 [Parus major]
MMQELVAGVEKIRFDSEADVEELGARPLPFLGVDSVQGHPQPGGAKPTVCKHWLRGLCKRGDGCGFLHDSDASRMPECCLYSKFGQCSNKDCPFLHLDGTASTVGCPWYDRGFCRHGPLCKYKHTRRVMCANYLVGFCPEGPKCKFVQKLDIPGGWYSGTWLLQRRWEVRMCHPRSHLPVAPSTWQLLCGTPAAVPRAHRACWKEEPAPRADQAVPVPVRAGGLGWECCWESDSSAATRLREGGHHGTRRTRHRGSGWTRKGSRVWPAPAHSWHRQHRNHSTPRQSQLAAPPGTAG